MNRVIIAAVALYAAVSGYALPGDFVVLSDREVQPNDAAGRYYLGACAAGYLYNGSASALGAVSPYRVLADDARGKHFFLVSLPKNAALGAADIAALGDVRPVGDDYLLATRGDPGFLTALEPGLSLRELRPKVRAGWEVDAETPPTKKNATVEAAINAVTAEEYAGYILQLQSYKTRFVLTPGGEGSCNWLRNWYAGQNLDADREAYDVGRYTRVDYPEAGEIYLYDYCCLARRSRDGGASWHTVRPGKVAYGYYTWRPAWHWLDGDTGIFAGGGEVAVTADGGDTWEYSRYAVPPEGGYLLVYGVGMITPALGWLGYVSYEPTGGGYSRQPHLLNTKDGGRTWTEGVWRVPIINRLACYDRTRMWALNYPYGFTPYVYYSSDGGDSWAECSMSLASGEYVLDVAATGSREAWGVTSLGRVLHTTDGVAWQEVDTGFSGPFTEVEFPSADVGYIAGGPMVKTVDGGRTWTGVTSLPVFEYEDMAFADDRHGVIADYYGEYVYHTEDGGASWADITAGLTLSDYNVVAERRGTTRPDEIVIVGGHYDSTSYVSRPWDCPGADDNASGAAVGMVAARAFRNVNFERTVRFIAFGAEEGYGLGSEAHARECVARGEKLVAVINADMVSYDEEDGGRDDFSVASGEDPWLYEYLAGVGRLYNNGLTYDAYEFEGSDHISFWDVGYPALGIIEGEVGEGGVLDYPWYHTCEDTFDKIHPELGIRCARDLAAMVAHLAGVAGTFPDPPGPGSAAVPQGRPFAVYPNPYCYATCASGVSFVGLKAPATVEVYDLAGRRVTSASVSGTTDEYVWSPGGEALAPGVYLYRVEGLDQEESGKIIIAK